MKILSIKHLYLTGKKNLQTTIRCIQLFGILNTIPMVLTRLTNIIRPRKNFLSQQLINYPEKGNHYKKLSVSVVIPVKDAGQDLVDLLSCLKQQKGLKNLEIIIVDSGSTDNSLEIAKQQATKLIQIPPDEFSHSHARNLGAMSASEDYLLFLVQDALPDGEYWIYYFASMLVEQKVAAISCAESSKPNADMFYKVQSWHHYHWLLGDQGDRITSLPKIASSEALRINGSLSNVANLVKKDIFLQHKFQGTFAEDLDLGIRLIKDGQKLALVNSLKIIHSHNRPANYYFKRGYVDRKTLLQMFPNMPHSPLERKTLFTDIVVCYVVVLEVCEMMDGWCGDINLEKALTNVLKIFTHANTKNITQQIIQQSNVYLDSTWHKFLEELYEKEFHEQHIHHSLNKLMEHFSWILFQYLEKENLSLNQTTIHEIKSYFFRAHALLSGLYLADSINHWQQDKQLFNFRSEIITGI